MSPVFHGMCYHSQASLLLIDTLFKIDVGKVPEALSIQLHISKQMTAAFSLKQCTLHLLPLFVVWNFSFSPHLSTPFHTVHPSLMA